MWHVGKVVQVCGGSRGVHNVTRHLWPSRASSTFHATSSSQSVVSRFHARRSSPHSDIRFVLGSCCLEWVFFYMWLNSILFQYLFHALHCLLSCTSIHCAIIHYSSVSVLFHALHCLLPCASIHYAIIHNTPRVLRKKKKSRAESVSLGFAITIQGAPWITKNVLPIKTQLRENTQWLYKIVKVSQKWVLNTS